MYCEPEAHRSKLEAKSKKYESQSIDKKKKCRLQDCSPKRQTVCDQQKKSPLQTKTGIINLKS